MLGGSNPRLFGGYVKPFRFPFRLPPLPGFQVGMLILLEALPGNGVHAARSHLGHSSQDNRSLLPPHDSSRQQSTHSRHVAPLTGLIKTSLSCILTEPCGGRSLCFCKWWDVGEVVLLCYCGIKLSKSFEKYVWCRDGTVTVMCLRKEEEEERSGVCVVFVDSLLSDDVFILSLCSFIFPVCSEILFCLKCNKVTKGRLLWNQPSDCMASFLHGGHFLSSGCSWRVSNVSALFWVWNLRGSESWKPIFFRSP